MELSWTNLELNADGGNGWTFFSFFGFKKNLKCSYWIYLYITSGTYISNTFALQSTADINRNQILHVSRRQSILPPTQVSQSRTKVRFSSRFPTWTNSQKLHLHMATFGPYRLVEHFQADGALKRGNLLLFHVSRSIWRLWELNTALGVANIRRPRRLPSVAA